MACALRSSPTSTMARTLAGASWNAPWRWPMKLRPTFTVVTGDFISMRHDPLDDCLALLKQLKADAGIYGCLGNHEIAADCEDYARKPPARIGIQDVAERAPRLRFGQAELNMAGVDYQSIRDEYLDDAARLLRPGVTNLLLSHNPDVFPMAARARLGCDARRAYPWRAGGCGDSWRTSGPGAVLHALYLRAATSEQGSNCW